MTINEKIPYFSWKKKSMIILIICYLVFQAEFLIFIPPIKDKSKIMMLELKSLTEKLHVSKGKLRQLKHCCSKKVETQSISPKRTILAKESVILTAIKEMPCNLSMIPKKASGNLLTISGQCDYQALLTFIARCSEHNIFIKSLVIKKKGVEGQPLIYMNVVVK